MEILSTIVLIIGAAISLYVLVKILTAPIKLIFKLLLNAVTGFLLLFIANFISGFFDFSVPVNLITCLVSGVFGIPGVIFLFVVTYLFL